ncbi:MAG TPA: 4'-phosphopantetheinyl transferase superfamily protein [Thermoanaerobaculia bacterium]|jgi:4'-phosphopantetheinyl transferase|nr:4'-phosphopantetheinyl transferase superfamily protein [Thermoanaerobaculia bacterium]
MITSAWPPAPASIYGAASASTPAAASSNRVAALASTPAAGLAAVPASAFAAVPAARSTAAPAPLREGHVDVFAFALNPPDERLAALRAALAAEEHERAAGFRFDAHRRAFESCRGAVREILAAHLGCAPAAVRFQYGEHGKPALLADDAPLVFSVSHSSELGLCAISRRGALGVDVEFLRPLPDALAIAERFFSTAERDSLRTLQPPALEAAFFAAWTRKEAFIKALGEGLSHPLADFDVTLLPGEPARLLRVAGDDEAPARWRLAALDPAPGYFAALAAAEPVNAVACWSWPPG